MLYGTGTCTLALANKYKTHAIPVGCAASEHAAYKTSVKQMFARDSKKHLILNEQKKLPMSFIYVFIYLFIDSFIYVFNYLFIYLCIYVCNDLFIYLFVYV